MGTVVVLVILVAVVSGIIYKMYRDKKSGKTSCGGDCGHCGGGCH
ncbi:MAG: FeoB-associated Cys-rich membrane protein [Lachnospiraceae bacterium]|nr:FeoB-associated Cys-rich membrane protein [Lachnospiraceae bacterium]